MLSQRESIMAAGSQSRKLRDYIFNHKHKTERMNSKCLETLNSQNLLSVITLFNNTIPLKPSQQHYELGTKYSNTKAYGAPGSYSQGSPSCE